MDFELQVKNVLEVVANKRNIKKWRLERNLLSKDILNYFANLAAISLIDDDSGEATNVIIKIAPNLENPIMSAILGRCYDREVYFYTKFLPSVIMHTEMDLSELIPKCYHVESSANAKALVLQDMTLLGFRRHAKGMFFDEQHLLVTVQAVAKLHGLSMIINNKNVILPNIQMLKPYLVDDPPFHNVAQRFGLNKYLCLFDGMKCGYFLNDLCHYINNSNDFLDGMVKNAKNLVYVHGDMWKENVLFKYSEKQGEASKPLQACLVDYQHTRLMSPAAELLFLIMNSTESSVRRQHFHLIVATYHQTLQQVLKSNGLDTQMYSKEDLQFDLHLVFRSCFVLTFMSFLLWLGLEEPDSLILEKPKKHTTKDNDLPNKNLNVFKDIIECLFVDFRDLGFIVN